MWLQVICGSLHNILLTTEGEVYIWGHIMEGQLGTGTKQEEVSKTVKHILLLDLFFKFHSTYGGVRH